MGPKIGLDGVDNGFMMFDQFYVPKSALLNKTGDVDELGKYISPFKDKKKRLGTFDVSILFEFVRKCFKIKLLIQQVHHWVICQPGELELLAWQLPI